MSERNWVLGIDIGGVIIDRVNDNTDTSFFGDRYLETTAVPESFRIIGILSLARFGMNGIHLVSKCGPSVERKTLEWLRHHDFFERAGVLPENVHFCLKRSEKAGICRKLGVTHFVDDRLEVLSHLLTVPTKFLFRPQLKEVAKFSRHLPSVRQVQSWEQILQTIDQQATLPRA